MNTLLLGGTPNAGISSTIIWCINYLFNHGFKLLDYHNYNDNLKVTFISASDNEHSSNPNLVYQKKVSIIFLIYSIQNTKYERNYYFETPNYFISEDGKTLVNIIFEFLLARITRKKKILKFTMNWYHNAVQNMLGNILCTKPFEV